MSCGCDLALLCWSHSYIHMHELSNDLGRPARQTLDWWHCGTALIAPAGFVVTNRLLAGPCSGFAGLSHDAVNAHAHAHARSILDTRKSCRDSRVSNATMN